MARDNDGNPVLPVVHSSFVLEDAVKQFKVFVSDDANLLDAKLVSSLFSVIYFPGLLHLFLQLFLEQWSWCYVSKELFISFLFFYANRLGCRDLRMAIIPYTR